MAKRKAPGGRKTAGTKKTSGAARGATGGRKAAGGRSSKTTRAAKKTASKKTAGRKTAGRGGAGARAGGARGGAKKTAKATRTRKTTRTSSRPAGGGTQKRTATARSRAKTTGRRGGENTTPMMSPADVETGASGVGDTDETRGGGFDDEGDDEEELVPGAPSSLVPDRRAGRARAVALPEDEFAQEVSADGGLRAGDVDVNLAEAYAVGDEAPGGDNPTPDQDVVDLIGRSLGVEYEDNEELKGADKIADRDRKRWELDPASSEDYRDRGGKKR